MVATPHAAATLAALDILRAGGNAVDAAVAAVALLGIVDPTQTGIGGDCFALYAPAGGSKIIAINGSGWAPAGVTTAGLLAQGIGSIPSDSPLAVTVPGAVSAWARLVSDHGRLGLAHVLQPAIRAAADGFAVTERVAGDWRRKEEKLSRHPEAARIYLRDGHSPGFGSVYRLPELALALDAIAREGPDVFYQGWIADDMLTTLLALGGPHQADDFANFAAEYVMPISAGYRGFKVWQCPPNGVGMVVLMMLRALEGFDLSAFGARDPRRVHLVGEIGRLAYATRAAVLGDPSTGSVPLDELLSDAFAAAMRSRFSPERRLTELAPPLLPRHRDTVAVSVVDRDLNTISLINSNFDDFGSGIVTGRAGIVLQNRGCGFVVECGHPNTIEGRKRPVHTIIPALVTRADRAVLSFSVTGGLYQPVGHVALLSHLIDGGLALQDAIDEPRCFSQESGIEMETGFAPDLSDVLRSLGYSLRAASEPIGTAQAVWIDHGSGVLHGAADPRRDGLALGL